MHFSCAHIQNKYIATHFPPICDSTIDLTYCPVYIRNLSVLSEWNCLNIVIQPAMKGGPSMGSRSDGFLHNRLPEGMCGNIFTL